MKDTRYECTVCEEQQPTIGGIQAHLWFAHRRTSGFRTLVAEYYSLTKAREGWGVGVRYKDASGESLRYVRPKDATEYLAQRDIEPIYRIPRDPRT